MPEPTTELEALKKIIKLLRHMLRVYLHEQGHGDRPSDEPE